MELEILKQQWIEERNRLETRLKVNESFIRKLNIERTVNEFDKMLQISIMGKNLALVYCLISITLASRSLGDIAYSIPAWIAGAAMLWSYFSHRSIQRQDYHNLPIIELQKTIFRFRLHTAANAKYDTLIVTLWLITVIPIALKALFQVEIYSNLLWTSLFLAYSISVTMLIIWYSRKTYGDYNQKLLDAENKLEEIRAFEEN